MEVLRWNRMMLSLVGFNTPCRSQKVRDELLPSQDSFKWSFVFKWLKRFYHYSLLTLVFFGSFLTGYLTFTSKQLVVKILLIAMSFLFASISGMVIWLDMRLKTRSLSKALSKVIYSLNEKDIQYIRYHDKTGVITRLLMIGLPILVSGMYFKFTNKRLFRVIDVFFSNNFEQILAFAVVQVTVMFYTSTGHFYWTVVRIAKTYAQHSNKVIREVWKRRFACGNTSKVTPEDLQLVQQTLDKYYRFVREVNRSLGVIPLSHFATLFVDFVIVVSLVTLFSNISMAFGVIALASIVANQVIGIAQTVCMAVEVTNVIENAVFMADQLTTIPLPEDVSFSLLECRRSLTVFLQRQTSVVFSAQSTFNLEPAVVLSFINAVVPFTIMFITTIAQMNGDTHYFSNLLNSNNTSY